MPFKKGQSGNLKGRPKEVTNRFNLERLKDAIVAIEDKKKINYFEYIIERSLTDNKLLGVVLRKLVPDTMHQTVNLFPEEFLEKKIKVINKNGSHVPERFQRFMYGQN